MHPSRNIQEKAIEGGDIVRQKAHRGGETVTVITQFVGISLSEKNLWQGACKRPAGSEGRSKMAISRLRDQREAVAQILRKAGFRPVFAGGWLNACARISLSFA